MSGSREAPSAQELDRIVALDKKEALGRKMAAHEAELQRARAAKAEAAGGNELVQFEARFSADVRAAGEALQAAVAGADAAAALAQCAKSVEALHASIAAAAHFLPHSLREASSRTANELEAKVRVEKERVAPKKKFGFKNRSKLASGPMQVPAAADAATAAVADGGAQQGAGADADADAAHAPGTAAADVAAVVSVRPHQDSFAAVADCVGFRRQRGVRLLRAADGSMSGGASPAEAAAGGGGGGGGDFALEALEDCEVRLLCQSTAMWVRGLSRCTVLALPLPGSLYLSDCTDCTFVCGARQVRLHTSYRCDFYLHAASHPIIEACAALRFAPLPPLPPALAGCVGAAGMDEAHNDWAAVDDFGWLKARQSPNWAALPEAERRTDFDFFADAAAAPAAAARAAAAPAAATAPAPSAADSAGAGGEVAISVLFFAAAREEAGVSEAALAVPAGTDTDGLRALLLARFPGLQELLPRCALARNQEYVDGVATLRERDEVAVIPPVSGG